MMTRRIVDALSKALVATALMLTIAILVSAPISASFARAFTAVLLALGTVGLVALQFVPEPSTETVSQR